MTHLGPSTLPSSLLGNSTSYESLNESQPAAMRNFSDKDWEPNLIFCIYNRSVGSWEMVLSKEERDPQDSLSYYCYLQHCSLGLTLTKFKTSVAS